MTPPLSRRAVLRGAGASVALPFLDAMLPSASASPADLPVRMGFLFMPNGVRQDRWTPEGEGRDFKLSPILEPLAKHRDAIHILTHLGNRNSRTGDGHYAKTANWLTGTPITKTTGEDIRCGLSVDQVLARERGHLTRLPSLELGTEPVESGVDFNVNYTKLYGSYISWRTPTSPLPSEINPRHVFDRLFRHGKKNAPAEDRSVLDLVLEDAHRLQGRVGSEDKARLDEYLESLRALERRIEAEAAAVARGENLDPAAREATARLKKRIGAAFGNQPAVDPGSQLRLDHTEHSQIMLDLMTLAFRTDTTRVSTFMFGWAVSGKNFSFLEGVDGSHHELSHHQNNPKKLAQYERIAHWHTRQFAYLLDRLGEIPEGDGTLLDNTLMLFGSSMRDGNRHDPRNLPIVLAGGGGGVETGLHTRLPKDTPLCNLYLGMLRRAGLPDWEKFGDSTRAIV